MNRTEIHICAVNRPPQEYLFLLHEMHVFLASDKTIIPDLFGRDAPFERNRAAMDEKIRHLHFCFRSEWTIKWQRKTQYHRTSDNFIIYVPHWRFDNWFCILAVITPEAHRRINNLLPQIIQKAQWFNQLGKDELIQLDWLI